MNPTMVSTPETMFLPPGSSTVAPVVDELYYFIYWLSVVLFVAVIATAAYFVVKYRRKSPDEIPRGPHHNTMLELFWTVVPTALVIVIFVWGFRGYMLMTVAPGNAMQINVTAKQWMWQFTYPNGFSQIGELTVPKGKPIKLVMTSEDVLHSFFVPNFRIKRDVVPGQYQNVWFEATTTGEFTVMCSEYCGLSHSDMLATVKVIEESEYDKWLEKAGGGDTSVPLVDLGKQLFTSKACFTCHSIDGSPRVGPTFKGLFGKDEKLTSGGTAKVDESYLRESLMDPTAKVVAGFPPAMPTYRGTLNDREISGLIEYVRSLK